jgi:septal ring factor EnvC (AmiA/AmiB activator)
VLGLHYYKVDRMVKKIHLTMEEIREKITRLEAEKVKEEVQKNKTKRRRIYAQLAQLQKALDDPEDRVVDPQGERDRVDEDKNKRI